MMMQLVHHARCFPRGLSKNSFLDGATIQVIQVIGSREHPENLNRNPPICGGTNGDVLIFPLDVPLIQSYLVGGAITILKNDGVCQWVSDDIPYMKWKIQNS